MAHDEMKTARFDDMTWLPPVERPEDLPTQDVRTGSICFVQGLNAVYRYDGDGWVVEATRDDALQD